MDKSFCSLAHQFCPCVEIDNMVGKEIIEVFIWWTLRGEIVDKTVKNRLKKSIVWFFSCATLTIFFMSSFSFRLSLVSLYKLYRIVPPLSNLEKTQFSLPLNEFWQFHLLFILCVLSFDNPMKFATLTIHYKHHDIWPSPIKLASPSLWFFTFDMAEWRLSDS